LSPCISSAPYRNKRGVAREESRHASQRSPSEVADVGTSGYFFTLRIQAITSSSWSPSTERLHLAFAIGDDLLQLRVAQRLNSGGLQVYDLHGSWALWKAPAASPRAALASSQSPGWGTSFPSLLRCIQLTKEALARNKVCVMLSFARQSEHVANLPPGENESGISLMALA
jgi:hypothetical protein